MPSITFFTYHQVVGFSSILRLHNRQREDGTLIIDVLSGKEWWRCEPKTAEQMQASTKPILDFKDTYPQRFLGRDK